MKRVGIITVTLLGLFVLSGVAHAEIFKWVDANGKVHYSDRKSSTQAQTLNVKTGASTLDQTSDEVEQRLQYQQLCAALQDQLKSYNQGKYRWYELDEASGDRKYLSDEQIEAKKQELQTEIKSNC